MSEIDWKSIIESELRPILITNNIDKAIYKYCNESKIDIINFNSGDGYIQHDKEVIDRIQKNFLKICYNITKIDCLLEDNINRQGIVGRYLDDYHSKYNLYKYWHKFMCIDQKYREWGQPYFAINIDKGVQRSLNYLPIVREVLRSVKLDELLDG